MSAPKHTPGPWAVGGIFEEDGENRRGITSDDGTKYHRRILLAQVQVPTGLSEHHPVVEANARLMAASPELLKACRAALYDEDKGWTLRPDTAELLRAAIAKAEAQTP